jgi:hypothetical protein
VVPEAVIAVVIEAAEAASEVEEEKEEKVKKVDTVAVEVDIAVAEAAVVREEISLKVKLDQKVKTDQEAEVEEEADHKVKKVAMLVMKVFSMSKERKELTTLAKMSISKERRVKNGTHMTEDLVPEEVENSRREAMVRVTLEKMKMK